MFTFWRAGHELAGIRLGKILKRDVVKGQAILGALLEQPKEVIQGETVNVEAVSGQAVINFDSKAQTGGRKGDVILVQIPRMDGAFAPL